MQNSAFFEIFEMVDKAKGKAKKIAILHNVSASPIGKTFKAFLDYTFNPNIVWLLPEGEPPYKPSEDDPNLMILRLLQDFRLLQHFLNIGPYKNMENLRRETMYISLLQTIHPKEAKLLNYVKDNRSLPYKSVTKALIAEAFPLLAASWEKKQ